MASADKSYWKWIAFIGIVTLGVFLPTLWCGFVSFDDPQYLLQNPRVPQGLNWDNISWAFSSTYFANWHPLTWLVYFSTAQVFGMSPAAFHAVNLVLHSLNAVLIFALLVRLTGYHARGAIVALLFAVHPLHVESVAWASELKDVLSTTFFLLTIVTYGAYVSADDRRQRIICYLLTCGGMALGLMAKPMLVTLPGVLLVLDFWPLRRKLNWRMWLDKLPLIVMAIASSIVTLHAQRGARANEDVFSTGARVANAVSSIGHYIWQTFWPAGLSVFYPHPAALKQDDATIWFVASLLGILGITSLAIWNARRKPYLLVGWLWFLGVLVPVLGLVQVGEQARADRYTYVALIGLFIMIVWWAADAFGNRKWLAPITVVVLLSLVIVTENQLRYWRDSSALWTHALAVNPSNYLAQHHLALAAVDAGQPQRAMELGSDLVRVYPEKSYGYSARARAFDVMGRPSDAAADYKAALLRDPENAELHNNLASALATIGQLSEAEVHFKRSLEINPDAPGTHRNYGIMLASQNRVREAVDQWRQSLRLNPSQPDLVEAIRDAGVVIPKGAGAT